MAKLTVTNPIGMHIHLVINAPLQIVTSSDGVRLHVHTPNYSAHFDMDVTEITELLERLKACPEHSRREYAND
jgi:hypothetical protein